ncbi:matrixin family metalloprotease [Mesorhizobium sp. M1169]|uniref:matrixin family metalloprotease n=1 Tax=Mesorhizobium sp. M1169 TaxID=2957066 RepID=UPI003335D121
MARTKEKTLSPAKSTKASVSPELRDDKAAERNTKPLVHVIREGVRCDTEERGHKTPKGKSPLEIVVDASEGFIPLWAKGTTLRWKFRESSVQSFADPAKVKAQVEDLFAKAILGWGDAAPIKFAQRDDAWDFEIVVKHSDDCDVNGCVLASAFFPDGGRHVVTIYPKIFEQDPTEQIETLVHEIGHIFGLRHFFAQVSETAWPSIIFGTHKKFSIMNYGADSKLTADDTADLKKLYSLAWSGQLTEINGTPIKFMTPFHTSGEPTEIISAMEPAQTLARVQQLLSP